jgi:signal transduction histidine kinase
VTDPRRLHSVRTELLLGLGFLTSSAVLIAGLTTMIVVGTELATDGSTAGRLDGWLSLGLLWLGSTILFVLFGAHLVRRVVLKPLVELSAQADRLAEGRLDGSPPALESAEMAHLAERFRVMAAQLLDAQSHLVRAEKMAGIGRLAAGVAHEIRNPLGAIANYAEVLRRRETAGTATARRLDGWTAGDRTAGEQGLAAGMAREIERIDRIVESLLDYSRPPAVSGPVDLNASVARGIGYLRDQGVFPNGQVQVTLEPGLPRVRADQSALEQVVVNLLLNARDATRGGRVWVGTVARPLVPRYLEHARPDSNGHRNGNGTGAHDRAPRPWRPDLAQGTRGVLLYVADEGPGVPEAERDRIFDPFFTTKPPGQGTGLGLAIVQSTVDGAGGLVWVDRAREGGAVFKVFLPAADDA